MRYDVAIYNIETGEQWEVTVDAASKQAALTKALRRKRFVEWFLESGPWTDPFQFKVTNS